MELLNEAEGFLICTGAGMSSDSGVPIYRKNNTWGPLQEELDQRYSGLLVEDIHDFGKSGLFQQKGELLWAYFRDLRQVFLSKPHSGYYGLNSLIRNKPYFVVTSNIDHMHVHSGLFPMNVVEAHGSLIDNRGNFRVQCSQGIECNNRIWSSDEVLPRCPVCHLIARPNCLSFNDEHYFVTENYSHDNMVLWLNSFRGRLAIFEIGVGTEVKTISNRSRGAWKDHPNSILFRINPTPDPEPLPMRYINLSTTAKTAFTF